MEIANFAPDERVKYQHEMTTERDRINQLAYARRVSREEGEIKGREEVARNLLAMDMPIADISRATGLSEDQVRALK